MFSQLLCPAWPLRLWRSLVPLDETNIRNLPVKVCDDCRQGTLSPGSFRKLMEGEELVHDTTREHMKAVMDDICGFCRLLWMSCQTRYAPDGEGPLINDVRFCLRVQSEGTQAGFRNLSPERVQYISVTPAGGPGKRYYLYASENDPAAEELKARTPLLAVGTSRAYELANNHITDCIKNHANCPKPAQDTLLPTRVIDCKNPSRPKIFLSKGTTSSYVALSYVRGQIQPYRLRTSNLKKYVSRGIQASTLGKTIRDAIQATHRLGLRYLWVDALCIIQDSDEDKANELVRMRNIYRDAHLTIIASSARAASAGFLQSRPMPPEYLEHIGLPFHTQDNRAGTMFVYTQDGPAMVYDAMKEPVNTRAWCLQERLLSPRKLVYASDTLQYHCQTAFADVGDSISGKPVGERLPDIMFHTRSDTDVISPLAGWTPTQWQGLHENWRMIVSNYTHRGLSVQEDKLLAFAGVAEEFHRIWHAHSGRYLAGVWEGLLPDDLLWARVGWQPPANEKAVPDDPVRPRLARSFTPSWSWASVDGHVLPDDTAWEDHNNTDCQVLQCNLALKDTRLPYGHLTAASLHLRAVVVPTPWMVLPDTQGGAARYLSLYMPTDSLRSRMSADSLPTRPIVVGTVLTDDISQLAETVVIHHSLTEQLLAFDSNMQADDQLLLFMGDVSIFFDSSERFPSSQVCAMIVRRFEVDGGIGAKGLLLADAGWGRYTRIAQWKAFMQWSRRGHDEQNKLMPTWFDWGSETRCVEMI